MDDLILLTDDLHEIGPIRSDIDIEIGRSSDDTNDFEISMPITTAGALYIPGTELGGLIEKTEIKTGSQTATYSGWTWRGLLTQDIISPPSGSDYRIVSGDANAIIKDILSDRFGGLFYVPDEASGLTISSYQFVLYTTVLDGLTAMVEDGGYRLAISADKVASGEPIRVSIRAVKAEQVSGTVNADSPVQLTVTEDGMGINHLACLGKGDLKNRTRVDLYIDGSGNVSQTKHYTGRAERTAYYDANNDELADLIKNGAEKLLEQASSRKMEIKVPDDLSLEVGDIVNGSYQGIGLTAPITGKIVKITGGYISTEYKIKEDK